MSVIASSPQIVRMPRGGMRADFTHPILNGCVGWWPLTDGAGGVARDISGQGNDGTQSGGVSWINTELGRASSFDGVDDRFDLTTLGGHDVYTTATTLSMWCYLRDDSLQQYWFNKGDSANSNVGLFAWTPQTGHLELKLFDLATTGGATKRFNGLATQMLDKWTHLVFISAGPDFTLGSNLDVYVDGVLQTATSSTNGDGFGNGEESGGILTIGGRYYDNNRNIDADFQNVRIWNRALSATEVSQLYTQPWSGLEALSPFAFYTTGAPPSAGASRFLINGFSNLLINGGLVR